MQAALHPELLHTLGLKSAFDVPAAVDVRNRFKQLEVQFSLWASINAIWIYTSFELVWPGYLAVYKGKAFIVAHLWDRMNEIEPAGKP